MSSQTGLRHMQSLKKVAASSWAHFNLPSSSIDLHCATADGTVEKEQLNRQGQLGASHELLKPNAEQTSETADGEAQVSIQVGPLLILAHPRSAISHQRKSCSVFNEDRPNEALGKERGHAEKTPLLVPLPSASELSDEAAIPSAARRASPQEVPTLG